jgi:hypothetical protein
MHFVRDFLCVFCGGKSFASTKFHVLPFLFVENRLPQRISIVGFPFVLMWEIVCLNEIPCFTCSVCGKSLAATNFHLWFCVCSACGKSLASTNFHVFHLCFLCVVFVENRLPQRISINVFLCVLLVENCMP